MGLFRTVVLASIILSVLSHAGDSVKFALVGRDECHARLVSSAFNQARYEVERWRIQRTVKYEDVRLQADAASSWSSMWAAVRNGVLVPIVGDRVFLPQNRDVSLTGQQSGDFPFYEIVLTEVPVDSDVPDSRLVDILIHADRTLVGDFGQTGKSFVELRMRAQFVDGGWPDVLGRGRFKIALGKNACASYEETFGGATAEVPGLGLNQLCAWLKSRPELSASRSVMLESQNELGFIEGISGTLKFVGPSVKAQLVLQSDPGPAS